MSEVFSSPWFWVAYCYVGVACYICWFDIRTYRFWKLSVCQTVRMIIAHLITCIIFWPILPLFLLYVNIRVYAFPPFAHWLYDRMIAIRDSVRSRSWRRPEMDYFGYVGSLTMENHSENSKIESIPWNKWYPWAYCEEQEGEMLVNIWWTRSEAAAKAKDEYGGFGPVWTARFRKVRSKWTPLEVQEHRV